MVELKPNKLKKWGREVLDIEAKALKDLANRMDSNFVKSIKLLAGCKGDRKSVV